MATQLGDEGAVGRNGGFDTGSPRGDGYEAVGASSLLASLAQAGADLASALAARPSLVAGIVAVTLAALIGSWLASRFPRRPAAPELPDLAITTAARGAFRRAGRRLSDAAEDSAELAADAASAGARRAAWGGRAARRRGAKAADRLSDRGPSVERMTDQVQAGVSLIPLGLRLLSNPIVRYYIRRALARQVAQTFGR